MDLLSAPQKYFIDNFNCMQNEERKFVRKSSRDHFCIGVFCNGHCGGTILFHVFIGRYLFWDRGDFSGFSFGFFGLFEYSENLGK